MNMAAAFQLMPRKRFDVPGALLKAGFCLAVLLMPIVLLIGALLMVGMLDWAFTLPPAFAGLLAAYLAALLALVLGMYMGGRGQ
jgi:hypothetical protein